MRTIDVMQASFIEPAVRHTAFGIAMGAATAPPEYAMKKAATQRSSNHMRDVKAPFRYSSVPIIGTTKMTFRMEMATKYMSKACAGPCNVTTPLVINPRFNAAKLPVRPQKRIKRAKATYLTARKVLIDFNYWLVDVLDTLGVYVNPSTGRD